MNDQLANDRTFLAWLRTAIALCGLGFVVAKVALLVGTDTGTVEHEGVYTAVGCLMVVGGAALVVVGYLQHRQVARVLAAAGEDELPMARWPQAVTAVAVVGALFLAVLVAFSS